MDGIARVQLAGAESGAVNPDPDQVAFAVGSLLRDGAVIVAGAVDPERLDRLATTMSDDLEVLLRRPERAENFSAGHLQQDPPPRADLLWPEVLTNPFVLRVCQTAMGQPLKLTGYTNNTNLPGSVAQAVHVDEGQRWPGLSEAHPPARLTVNIPLSATDESRGAIELWPGTHLDTRLCQFSATADEGISRALQYMRAARQAEVSRKVNRRVGLTVPEPMVQARMRERPPVRAVTEPGSVIIRDPRLWHRGMPNTTDQCRFMLALTYDPRWRASDALLEFPQAASWLAECADLEVRARFVDGPIDHLARHLPPKNSPLRRARPGQSSEKVR
ncbi:phytanoyl-CoA dioxygenase family protein [Nonomuraea purpurea]|uniref:Phytanoyl-CoA dioxygenase family protein n=1 Tax=Nonomuraea purpurea TaxID=1849276 RepID=A0ABV8GTP1_9ACTN